MIKNKYEPDNNRKIFNSKVIWSTINLEGILKILSVKQLNIPKAITIRDRMTPNKLGQAMYRSDAIAKE